MPQLKAEIGKRAAECGVVLTLRRYLKDHPTLKESTWKNVYTQEIKRRIKSGDSATIQELPVGRRGRPLLLGDELDKQVQRYVIDFRERSSVVNTAIVVACAEAIVKNKDSNLLSDNGGHIVLTNNEVKSILRCVGFVKRKVTTVAKVAVSNFEDTVSS